MIYYFDSVYVIGGLALLFLILLAFFEIYEKKKQYVFIMLFCYVHILMCCP